MTKLKKNTTEYCNEEARQYTITIGSATLIYLSTPTYIKLYSLRVPAKSRKKGAGRAAMVEFLAATDKIKKPVYLDASPLDKSTNLRKLVNFYQSLGFIFTGRSANMAGDPEMMRPVGNNFNEKDDDMRRNPAPPASLKLFPYYSEDADEEDEKDAKKAWKIQSVSGIRITKNNDLVVIAKIGNKVVGAGFYGIQSGYGAGNPMEASFDIVVDEKSRGKGIGEAITKYLIGIYKSDRNSYDDDLALNVEVVNPIMEKVLDRMGYIKVNEYGKILYRDPEAPEIR